MGTDGTEVEKGFQFCFPTSLQCFFLPTGGRVNSENETHFLGLRLPDETLSYSVDISWLQVSCQALGALKGTTPFAAMS